MKKYWILIVIVLLAVVGYNYLYKKHRIIESEAIRFSVTAQQIQGEFNIDPVISLKKYGDKTIEISGLVSEIDKTEITIDDKVFCQFSEEVSQNEISLNSKITVKGRLIGYDDLLEQVKLDQCIIN
ncbi:OB-fold protein [Aequorivita marina]|uniref:OB-fold protein n=1 Tax=Aequorivita marina TaxID=3073654 RepID=UPI0028759E9D|nr:hypothetical protein [Aequorivita sp. S2608]MDS1298134.1 hypothetical protein [Aequorivita sp. S2608]